jgi:hypothetical protein
MKLLQAKDGPWQAKQPFLNRREHSQFSATIAGERDYS